MDIRCNVTLSDVVDTPITIMRQWFRFTLLTNGSDYTITNDTLRINQLSVSRDNGRPITCLVTVVSSTEYVLQNSVIGSTLLTVHGEAHALIEYNDLKILLFVALSNDLFTPDIIIPGVPTAGDNFNITCRLDGVVERLVDTPVVILEFSNAPGGLSGDQSQDGLAYIRPRFFDPGMTDDSGTYSCIAIILSWKFISSSSGTLQMKS